MNELAILYDKVCAAHPAAIARTKWGELVCQWNGETLTNGADDIEHRKVRFWCWANGMSRHWRSEEEAEAIILKHWLGMLPDGYFIQHNGDWWQVQRIAIDGFPVCYELSGTPVEAIAAYLLDQAG